VGAPAKLSNPNLRVPDKGVLTYITTCYMVWDKLMSQRKKVCPLVSEWVGWLKRI